MRELLEGMDGYRRGEFSGGVRVCFGIHARANLYYWEACPDVGVSHCQVSDEVQKEFKTGVNFVIIPIRGVGRRITNGERPGIEVEEGQDLGEGRRRVRSASSTIRHFG